MVRSVPSAQLCISVTLCFVYVVPDYQHVSWFAVPILVVTFMTTFVCLQSMAWLGQKVVLCTSLRYMLLHPTQGTTTQLFALAEDAPSPTSVQSIPSANLAVLLMVLLPIRHHAAYPLQSLLTGSHCDMLTLCMHRTVRIHAACHQPCCSNYKPCKHCRYGSL